MTKLEDSRRDDLSEPEISIGTIIQAHSEDFASNIIGERFGKYLLVGEIAVGGMAEVFLGVHKGVESFIKVVVIKRVLPHLSNNPEFVRMFCDEARLAARIEHPNIVRIYEFGEVNGQYFTAMEYLPGEDLFKALNNLSVSRQLMPLNIAVGIGVQVCNGLHFAHQFTDTAGKPLNLVHRDINPANIIITYGGEVKIIDFGVAKTNANVQTLGDERVEPADNNREAQAGCVQFAFARVGGAPVFLIRKDRKAAGARGHFQGEHACTPVGVGNFAGDFEGAPGRDFVRHIGAVGFDHQVGVGKAVSDADLHAGFTRVELHSLAAAAFPGFSPREAERVEKLHQRAVILLASRHQQLV